MTYYQVHPIDEHTWRLEDCFHSYMYLIEGQEKALLFDTGIGVPGLAELVKKLTTKSIFVVNSHGHLDHIGGNSQFERCYLKPQDKQVMQEHGNPFYRKMVLQSLVHEFQMEITQEEMEQLTHVEADKNYVPLDEKLFDLGKRTLEIIETPGHTKGSICLLDKENRMLFSADTVCNRGILLFFDHFASVAEFKQSIQHLQEKSEDFDVMWPGHHECPLDKAYLEEYLECADNILKHPENGEPIQSNIGEGLIQYHKRISITYRQ